MLEREVTWAPIGQEDVLAIGSVVGLYATQGGRGLIWGSGAAATQIDPALMTPIRDRFLAIRGPNARRDLGLPADLPLGDPGLTVRAFHPAARRRSGTLVVPHFNVYASATGRRKLAELRTMGYTIMSPTTAPREMVTAIAGAERVISSGMHGIILSHALRTPVSAITFSDGAPTALPYKYSDYNASVGLDDRLHSWTVGLSETEMAGLTETAVTENDAVDARIDELVSGLYKSAAPLRSRS
ncbi:hypothetical protein [Frondihabitans sp. 762G35]|uniref:hypothetical protein n=1 Tax=Frondihabitans sp. 762G35 TaxID=1446794 RepID=UPI000F4FDD25|nr:hypothetical protein [Frondihabitans sp. 762G35]